MRLEALYLQDIVEAACLVADFIAGQDFESFSESEILRSAIAQKLTVIGEAAARLSDPLKARHPGVPWQQIVAFRNILVHAYFGIDWEIVWKAASRRCPEIREQAARILEREFASGTDDSPLSR